MGRKVAILWHASFTVAAGVLYFYFVLPRWPELMGDTTHGTGTTLRIVTGLLIGLAALPVVFTLLRTRKPELGTPQLALSIRTWSIIAHVLAGVLIVGAAISEIWFSLDDAGQWLFALYAAAAAVALLGFSAFYLSFVAELPPPPPKPLKPKKVKEPRGRGRKGRKGETDETDEEAGEAEESDDSDDTDDTEVPGESEDTAAAAEVTETAEADEDGEAEVTEAAETVEAATDESTTDEAPAPGAELPQGGLRNRRPTGKTSHRRRRSRGGVVVDEQGE